MTLSVPFLASATIVTWSPGAIATLGALAGLGVLPWFYAARLARAEQPKNVLVRVSASKWARVASVVICGMAGLSILAIALMTAATLLTDYVPPASATLVTLLGLPGLVGVLAVARVRRRRSLSDLYVTQNGVFVSGRLRRWDTFQAMQVVERRVWPRVSVLLVSRRAGLLKLVMSCRISSDAWQVTPELIRVLERFVPRI